MIEKLKELANKKSFTKEEKAWIIETSKELGLEFVNEKGCSTCYVEQVMKIYKHLSDEPGPDIDENKESDYILKPHIDFVLHGVRYNNATLDEKKAKYLLSLGFEKWFLKIKDENNTENEMA